MDVDVEGEVEVEPMLMLKEMEGRTRISLLDTEIEKLSRRNAYRQVISALTKTIFIHSLYSTMMIICRHVRKEKSNSQPKGKTRTHMCLIIRLCNVHNWTMSRVI